MTVLDVARGAYVRLPLSTRAHLGRFLQYVPTSIKFGKTYRHWRGVIDRAKTDTDFVRSYRQQALGEVVQLAIRNAPYYTSTLKPVVGHIAPDELLGSEAWSRLPVLSRQIVLDHRDEMCTVPLDRLDRASTDGSSGEPLSIMLDRNRSPIEYAFIHDAWSTTGFTAHDWRCVFRGFDLIDGKNSHMEIEPALKELRFSVFHLDDATMASYLAAIREKNVRFIHGYPSAMAIFAQYLLRTGTAPLPQIRGIFPISEKLFPHQRDLFTQVFDRATIVPFYGLSEKVAFAVERANEPDTYEFNPIYGYTELVDDDGQPITTPGKTGRVVSTGLMFRGMPLIRYDTRDAAQLVELPSASNGYRLILNHLAPRRSSEYLVSRSGSLIPFNGLCVPIDRHDLTREVQFCQLVPGEVELRVVTEGGQQPDFSDYLTRMTERAAGDLTIHLKIVDELPMTGRGKRKFIDQRLAILHMT